MRFTILKTFSIFYSLTFSLSSLAQELPYLEKVNGEVIVNKEAYNEYLREHPFATRKPLLKEDIKKMDKKDRPDLAYEHDWLMTQDPRTGRIEWARLIPIINQLQPSNQVMTVAPGGNSSNQWTERGPNNIGGRVRAIMFDPNDNTNKRVIAGGVGGGLWYKDDITSTTTSWTAVNDFWANIAVSAITHDPTSDSTWYVGTGEGYGNADAIRGGGIWKTTDNGQTWNQLTSTSPSSTSNFRYVMDLVVTSTGRLVVAAFGGLYTSDNGGTSFTRRQSSSYFSDIEIAANGHLYAGTRYSGRLYKSTNNGTSWTQITNLGGNPDRIEIACAPSNANTVYVVASGGSGDQDTELFKKSTNGGSSWTNCAIPRYASDTSKHFTRRQAWYDLILWVHPTNPNLVVAGGVDIHRSTNGGSSWSPVSYWNSSQSPLPVVHADIHALISRPGNNNEVVIGNDGGVYYSTNLGNSSATPTFSKPVKDFNVTQYYSGTLHPGAGSNVILGGTQDNGSITSNSAGIGAGTEVTGGDGAFCFIDQNNPSTWITSYVYNNWRRSNNSGSFFNYLPSDNTGFFINPADYDDNLNILYSSRDNSTLKRITNMTGTYSIGTITITGMSSKATHVRVSPYTTTSTTLFVGSGGDVFKVTNANGTPSATKISPSSFPSGSISCIEVGASENELLVTFSNYGVSSVWYTSNGGTTWINKEGNLPDMPVRWALFNPRNRDEVILATEVGVWSTSDISATSVNWSASNLGLANTRVDMLHYRNSDSLILAATHGRGMFTGRFKAPSSGPGLPTASFTASDSILCAGDTVTFTSTSTGSPTSLNWTFTGGSPSSSNSMGPVQVVYSGSGNFAVKLVATNSAGADSVTKTSYINVTAKPNASASPVSTCINSPAFTLTNGTPSGGTYTGPAVSGGVFNPAVAGTGFKTIKYKVGSGSCSDSTNFFITVNAAPSVSLGQIGPFCTSDPAQTLNQGSPSGGVYSGTGVSGSTFSPSTAGVGSHSIKYVFTNTAGCKDSASTSVSVSNTLNVSVTSIPTQCSNGNSITLNNGSPKGGRYSGTGITNDSIFNPATAGVGIHTIQYKAGSGNCVDSATFQIRVTAPPTVSITSFGPLCTSDAPFTMSGLPAGGTFSGPGVSGSSFDPGAAGAGTHAIKYSVMDTAGCTDSANTSVLVSTGSSLSFGSLNNVCENGTPITLNQGSPVGGTYSGPGVSNDSIFNPSIAGRGTHTLTYSDSAACGAKSVTQTITVDSVPLVTVSGDTGYCPGGSVQIVATGGGTYEWSPRAGLSNFRVANPNANPSTSTMYTVMVTGSNGCNASDSVMVSVYPAASIDAGQDDTICRGDTFQLAATGGMNYTWTPPTGLFSTTGPNPKGSLTSDQIYFLTATDSNGCQGQDQVNIFVRTATPVSIGNLNSVCTTDTVFLLTTGSPSGGVYYGNGVINNSHFAPSRAGAGTHTIFYASALSGPCISTDSTTIVVSDGPKVNWASVGTSCEGDSVVTLNASPSGGTYSGNGVSGNTFDPSLAGRGSHPITYTVSGPSGCVARTTQIITVNPGVDIDSILGLRIVVKRKVYNYSVKALNGSSYNWTVNGGTLISQSANTATVRWGNGASGEVSVNQTNPQGCQDSMKMAVEINVLSTEDLVLGDRQYQVFPNPSDNEINIKLNQRVGDAEISLIDLSGKVALQQQWKADEGELLQLDVSKLPSGTYHLQIREKEEFSSVPIVISH